MVHVYRDGTGVAQGPPLARSIDPFVFTMLFACYVVNLVDRSIMSFVAVPLRNALNLSYAQFGILTGPVFSITYGVFGLFFAYYADRGNRARMLAAVLVLWSVATVASGLVSSFFQLLLARLLVGVGEAGGTPTAMALVMDYAPKERLSSAYAIFILATPCGILVAAVLGSYLAQHYGWRMAFMGCGVLGLPLAGLVALKLRDPRVVAKSIGPASRIALSPQMILREIGQALKVMSARRSLMFLLASFSISFFLGTGVLNWSPIFFSRYQAFNAHDASLYVGLAFCAGVIPGIILGGLIADRLAKPNIMWMIYVPTLSLALSLPLLALMLLTPNKQIAIWSFAFSAFLSQMSLGPLVGAFNAVVPSENRAMGNSCLMLGAAVVSGGLGNLLVGVLSDRLEFAFGASSFRLVLLGVTLVFGVLSVLCLLLATRQYKTDLRYVGW